MMGYRIYCNECKAVLRENTFKYIPLNQYDKDTLIKTHREVADIMRKPADCTDYDIEIYCNSCDKNVEVYARPYR